VVVIGLVAAYARDLQVARVIVAHVALDALQAHMGTGKRKLGVVVIEGRVRPHGDGVAKGAIRGEP